MKIQASELKPVLRDQAAKDGITEVTLIGTNGKSGDHLLTAYQFGDVRVIETNGGAIWEESDPQDFAELMAEIEA